jgi:branched-subunit amino acid aminotransferase/4-amino-4-deoxychorismate lyase
MKLSLPPGARLPARTIWLNGELVRDDQAALSVWDRGARDGGALFETIRTYAGEPFAWTKHLERLVLSAAELGFPVPPGPDALREAVRALLVAERLSDAVVRITVTRGIPGGRPVRTCAWVEAEPLAGRLWAGTRVRAGEDAPAGGRAILSRTPFTPGTLGRHKTTSRLAYDLAREEARAAGADEALLVSPTGHVLEGAVSNLFIVRPDGVLVTPPLAADVLPGITRARMLAIARALGLEVVEADVSLEALQAADEAFVTNSVQEVVPLAVVAGRALPSRDVGLRLLAEYRRQVAAG